MSAVQLDGETPGEGTEVEAQALRSENVYWVDYRSGKSSASAPRTCRHSLHDDHRVIFLTSEAVLLMLAGPPTQIRSLSQEGQDVCRYGAAQGKVQGDEVYSCQVCLRERGGDGYFTCILCAFFYVIQNKPL